MEEINRNVPGAGLVWAVTWGRTWRRNVRRWTEGGFGVCEMERVVSCYPWE